MKFIPQLDETDCGVACLAMVAEHYGFRVSRTAIREIAGTDRNGTNLAGMLKAGLRLGFDTRALRGDTESLTTDIVCPFVAHITVSRAGTTHIYHHFVVIAQVGKNDLLVYDPAEGKRRWTREEFLKVWTGYVVFLTPNAEFKPVKETKGLFARFLPLLVPHTGTLVRVAIASLLLIDEVRFSRNEFTLHLPGIGVFAKEPGVGGTGRPLCCQTRPPRRASDRSDRAAADLAVPPTISWSLPTAQKPRRPNSTLGAA